MKNKKINKYAMNNIPVKIPEVFYGLFVIQLLFVFIKAVEFLIHLFFFFKDKQLRMNFPVVFFPFCHIHNQCVYLLVHSLFSEGFQHLCSVPRLIFMDGNLFVFYIHSLIL